MVDFNSLPVTLLVTASKEGQENYLGTLTVYVPLTHLCFEFWGSIEEIAEL